jgi:hypothetical protein
MQCSALILHEGLFYAVKLASSPLEEHSTFKKEIIGDPYTVRCKLLLPYTLKFSMETDPEIAFFNGIFSRDYWE